MSKYVNHKHGLIIGSDNIFFITHDEHAPEGIEKCRDGYRAIVWANGYEFDSYNTVNVFVLTPAQQILWERKRNTLELYSVLKNWPTQWLEKNVGEKYKMWDVRTHAERSTDAIFFKRRKDAIAFTRAIDNILKGIQPPKRKK